MTTFNEYLTIFTESIEATGTCYPDAYHYMRDHADKKLTLVHGLVSGQGHLEGIRYGHAWVLDGNKVIDPSIGRTFPKSMYYKVGEITKKESTEYTFMEMVQEVSKSGTYGPWG